MSYVQALASKNMPRSATQLSEKSRGPTFLQEFENSLPEFKNLEKEQHVNFATSVRQLCRYFDISEARLRGNHFFNLRSMIARLSVLYREYLAKDTMLASAILIVQLRIKSYYLDDQDENLVHNLTGLHIYRPIRLDVIDFHGVRVSRRLGCDPKPGRDRADRWQGAEPEYEGSLCEAYQPLTCDHEAMDVSPTFRRRMLRSNGFWRAAPLPSERRVDPQPLRMPWRVVFN
jgi:hypothetical protein